jgi:hypothetical protein
MLPHFIADCSIPDESNTCSHAILCHPQCEYSLVVTYRAHDPPRMLPGHVPGISWPGQQIRLQGLPCWHVLQHLGCIYMGHMPGMRSRQLLLSCSIFFVPAMQCWQLYHKLRMTNAVQISVGTGRSDLFSEFNESRTKYTRSDIMMH